MTMTHNYVDMSLIREHFPDVPTKSVHADLDGLNNDTRIVNEEWVSCSRKPKLPGRHLRGKAAGFGSPPSVAH
jgi:hypothetical protein